MPADNAPDTPAPEIGSKSHYICHDCTLRAVDDSLTHLANCAEIKWSGSCLLRAFKEFATKF
uniref:Uncharacterized protein n=1 Tax=Peronospora matthiolae TaxID=2874970 RepID=A0AAV1VBP6_9STRA